MTEMDRMQLLKDFLADNPDDAFARYGLALEYRKAGQVEQALAQFKSLIEKNPDYTAGYQMWAQTLAEAGRREEAARLFSEGIACARRTGNTHAMSEMSSMLEELKS